MWGLPTLLVSKFGSDTRCNNLAASTSNLLGPNHLLKMLKCNLFSTNVLANYKAFIHYHVIRNGTIRVSPHTCHWKRPYSNTVLWIESKKIGSVIHSILEMLHILCIEQVRCALYTSCQMSEAGHFCNMPWRTGIWEETCSKGSFASPGTFIRWRECCDAFSPYAWWQSPRTSFSKVWQASGSSF